MIASSIEVNAHHSLNSPACSCVSITLSAEIGSSPGVNCFPVFDRKMHPNGDANSGRFFLWEDVDTRVDLEWTVAVRILRQAHFLQTFARNVNPAVRHGRS